MAEFRSQVVKATNNPPPLIHVNVLKDARLYDLSMD